MPTTPRSRRSSSRSRLDANPLRSAFDATSPYVGHEFLEQLAEELSTALEVDLAFVASCPELDPARDGGWRVEAVARSGVRRPGSSLDLSASSLLDQRADVGPLLVSNNVALRFATDPLLVAGGFDSALVAPLLVPSGRRVGSLVLLDRRSLAPDVIDRYVLHLISQRCAAELERLERSRAGVLEATLDGATGLPNRLLFCDRLATAIERGRRFRQLVAVLDIELGQQSAGGAGGGASAEELAEAGRRLRGAVRASDAVGRLATREFGVVLESLQEWRSVESATVSVYQALTHAPVAQGLAPIEARVGVAVFPDDGRAVDDLLSRASRARGSEQRGVSFYGGGAD